MESKKKISDSGKSKCQGYIFFLLLLHVSWLIHIFLVGCWIGNAHYIIPYKNILYIGKLSVWTLPNFDHILTLYLYFNSNNNNNNVNSLLEGNKLEHISEMTLYAIRSLWKAKNIENVDKKGESRNPDIS